MNRTKAAAGDFREWDAVEAWAGTIAQTLSAAGFKPHDLARVAQGGTQLDITHNGVCAVDIVWLRYPALGCSAT